MNHHDHDSFIPAPQRCSEQLQNIVGYSFAWYWSHHLLHSFPHFCSITILPHLITSPRLFPSLPYSIFQALLPGLSSSTPLNHNQIPKPSSKLSIGSARKRKQHQLVGVLFPCVHVVVVSVFVVIVLLVCLSHVKSTHCPSRSPSPYGLLLPPSASESQRSFRHSSPLLSSLTPLPVFAGFKETAVFFCSVDCHLDGRGDHSYFLFTSVLNLDVTSPEASFHPTAIGVHVPSSSALPLALGHDTTYPSPQMEHYSAICNLKSLTIQPDW